MRWWAIAAILALGAALRVPDLSRTPPGLSPDEASNAVDARCLALWGVDHHGAAWPLYLRALGDYRDAAFTYMAAVPVWLRGDSPPPVRPLAAGIGLATVALTYLLGRRFFGERAGLWAALFLAVNPQHVLWSRLGMEAILVPLACVLCLLVYERCGGWPRSGPALVAVGLVLVIYSGPMGKPAAALLLLLFLTCPPGGSRPRAWAVGLGLLVLAAGSLPAWWAVVSGTSGVARYREVGIRSDSAVGWLAQAARNYVGYFSPGYLLLPQGGGAPDLPFAGKFGYTEFVCLLAGVAFLLRDRPRHSRLTLLFLMLYTVPAATTATLASSRVLYGTPVLCVAAGYGAARLQGFGRGRGRWVTAALLAGALGTAGLTALDLATTTNPHLDVFFSGPPRRAVAAALAAARPAEPVILDPGVPYGQLYYLEQSRPPLSVFRAYWEALRAGRGAFGRVLILPPREVLRVPHLRGVFVTRVTAQIPGARMIYRDGDYCVLSLTGAAPTPSAGSGTPGGS